MRNGVMELIKEEIELRYAGGLESHDAESMKIGGYALKFGQESIKLTDRYLTGYGYVDFKEIIEKGALDGADLEDVRLLYNHESGGILGRTTSETLKVEIDDIGLKFEATLPNTTLGRDVMENIRNGNVYQCSFGFALSKGGDVIKKELDGTYTRTLTSLSAIDDISLVTYPAYRSTDFEIALRSIKVHEDDKRQVLAEINSFKERIELEALKEEVKNGFN